MLSLPATLLALAATALAADPAPPKLTYLYSANLTFAAPITIGAVPTGNRDLLTISGGTVTGPKIKGNRPPPHPLPLSRPSPIPIPFFPNTPTTNRQDRNGPRLGPDRRQGRLQPRRAVHAAHGRQRHRARLREGPRAQRAHPLRDGQRKVRVAQQRRRVRHGRAQRQGHRAGRLAGV